MKQLLFVILQNTDAAHRLFRELHERGFNGTTSSTSSISRTLLEDPDFEPKAKNVLLVYKRIEWVLQLTRDAVNKDVSAHELCGEVFISYDEKPAIQAISNIAPDLPNFHTLRYLDAPSPLIPLCCSVRPL